MSHPYDYDIGVIGAGAGGLTVAAGAAQLGVKTVLIEKEDRLGGDCLHFGCVPSKTLIRSAAVYHQIKQAERYGLGPMNPPPVDFTAIAARIRSVIERIQQHDSPERFCGLGAQVRFGTPTFADEHVVKLGQDRLSARTWVIATGSSPFIPPIDGLAATPFVTNRDLFSFDRLPASMIVLGGGPIGIEMAQAFQRLGTRVHVVQKGPQILGKEDRDMADRVMEVLATEGVRFHLNCSVLQVRDRGSVREVRLQHPSGRVTHLQAQRLLVATGRQANVSGLGLERLEIAHTPRGIPVDGRLRTQRHSHIYAIGDVNGSYLFTHVAGYEGGLVVSNAVFHLPRKADYSRVPWCTYTDPELASIGMNEQRAREAGIEYQVVREAFRDNDRSLAEGYEEGVIKLVLDRRGTPLGVQIFGPHAGDLLGQWVGLFAGKARLSAIATAIHPYPTLGEINKTVAASFYSRKIFSKRVRKALGFFFQFKGRACTAGS